MSSPVVPVVGDRGEGGGLYIGQKPGNQAASGTGTEPCLDGRLKRTIADVLLDAGILVTARNRREELGTALECDGYGVEDIEPLVQGIMELAGIKRLGVGECVNLLRDRERLNAAVEDGRKLRAKKAVAGYPGAAIMAENKRRSAEANAEWEAFEAAKKAGLLPPLELSPPPWARQATAVEPTN